MKLGARELYNPRGRVFAIGDVHGEKEKLIDLLDKIKKVLKPEDHVVFVGDLVDVGLDTPGVLIVIQEFINFHPNTYVIKGNHEEMFMLAMKGNHQFWFANKGEKTLHQFKDYNEDPEDLVLWLEDNKITFLDKMIPYYETEDMLITHAPLNHHIGFGLTLEEGVLEKVAYDLRWHFEDPENKAVPGIDKLLVCGHQNNFGKIKAPRFYPEINRIYTDTGNGYYKDAPLAAVIVYPFHEIKPILSKTIE